MKIFCIRHGKSTHNVEYDKVGTIAYYDKKMCNSHLVPEGVIQATRLYENWKERKEIELIIVSPLQRTLETSECIFGKYNNIPVIVMDNLLEYPQGSHKPNQRLSKSELNSLYPTYNFEHNEYPSVYKQEETIDQLKQRVNDVKVWCSNQKKNNIALVGHNSFLKEFLHIKDNIQHCNPIIMEL